jgi:hypothetical protein
MVQGAFQNRGIREPAEKRGREGLRFLRAELPAILATRCEALSPRMVRVIEDLAGDWRRLDERIALGSPLRGKWRTLGSGHSSRSFLGSPSVIMVLHRNREGDHAHGPLHCWPQGIAFRPVTTSVASGISLICCPKARPSGSQSSAMPVERRARGARLSMVPREAAGAPRQPRGDTSPSVPRARH